MNNLTLDNFPLFSVTILTIFPEMFPGALGYSLAGKALKKGLWSYRLVNIRDFGVGRYKRVDDTPYGGGAGMVMRPDVLGRAIEHAKVDNQDSKIYYMSPKGALLTQNKILDVVKEENIIIICGRFEGIDQRVIEQYNIEEVSIGDYILSGGELAAMVLLDGCIRTIPGVMENEANIYEESFTFLEGGHQLLEYPLYTKPASWNGRAVPEVLTSGNHQEIKKWRIRESQSLTSSRRPDLLRKN